MTSVNQKIRYFLKSHKYQRIRVLVLLLLSVIVVTAVITGLIKPAVSMTGDLTCTVAEHIHTDECYADVLVCGLNESPAHYHDESCFEEKTVLVCGITDGSHIHTDECYELREVVVCNLPEGEGHTHNEQCYEHKLVCTQTEHIHSEECYEQQSDEEQEYMLLSGFSSNFSAQTVSYLSGTEIDTAVSVNFGEYISRVSYKPVSSSSSDENTKPVKFTVNYLLPSNTLMQVNNNRQIYLKLPENVVISDVQSGPVKENGVQTGTYQITNDGYIIIDFDANYVKDGSTEITGDITFNAFVKKTDSASDKETVTMGNASVDVDFSVIADTSPDLSVQKTSSGYDKVNNTIGYTVEISSFNGSGEGDITVTDYLDNADSSRIKLNLTSGQTISVTKTKSDSSTETVTANVAVGDDGKVTITGLPALLAGEKYSFTYSALLTPGTQAEIINANNKISVSNGTLTATDDDYTSVATGCILTKSGTYNDRTDNIEWKIKILNPYGVNLKGYTVTDEMLSQTVPGTLKVLEDGWKQIENAGTLDTNTNTFTFGSLTGTEYQLIYQTKSPDHGKTISNKAALKDSEGTSINEDTGNAFVGDDRHYIGKNSYSKGFDSSGNVRIGWSVSLQFQQGDFAGKIYTDIMTTDKTEHYMTVSQLNTIDVSGYKPGDYNKIALTKGTDYTIQCFDAGGAEIADLTAENIRICSYKITFADNEMINSLCDIEVTYESTGVLSNSMAVGETATFNNRVEMDTYYAQSSYTETKKEALKKHDTLKMGQAETSHKTTELDKTETGDYVLKWTIIANESNNYGNNDVTLTDTLPAGVTFITDSAVFMRHNGSYYETTSGMGTVFNAETNQIVFSIPASVHDGKAFRIDYSVSVTEEYLVNNSVDNSTAFTNTVSDGVNTATQTQKLSLPLITKTGSDPADVYDGDITYTIDVNPYSLDLSDSDTITVTDSLRHYSKKNEDGTFMYTWGFSASLINLKVIDADTGRELSPTEYVLTCSDEEIYTVNYSKFTLTLPDGKHFKIQYTYHLSINTDGDSDYKSQNGGKVENTATIDYGTGSEKFDYNKNYNLGRESSAHTATSDYIRIYKVDSGNFAVRLGGAVFNLYRWYDQTWQPLVSQNRNEEGGIIPTWGTDTPMSLETDNANGSYLLPELPAGVLYKLVEVKAPENYVARTQPYYFVFNSLPSQLPEGVQISQVSTLLKGGIINVANEPMTAVEMKVNKHWGEGTSSQPVDVQLLVSETPPDLPDTITVNISGIKGQSVTQKFLNKKTGDIVLTVETLNAYYDDPNSFKINGVNSFAVVEKSRSWNFSPDDTDYATCYEFTVGSISGSAEIDIYFSTAEDYSKYKLQASNCSSAENMVIPIPSGAVPVADNPTVTLSDANSWTYTWTGLPQCNANGTPYYYFVKELTQISGYTAEYDTNGINGGEVNLTNRKEAQKPTLPATGGTGVQRIVLTGALMMIVPVLCYYLINRRKKAVNIKN